MVFEQFKDSSKTIATLYRRECGYGDPLEHADGRKPIIRDDLNLGNLAARFSYTRLADITPSNQTTQSYENTQPWE